MTLKNIFNIFFINVFQRHNRGSTQEKYIRE